MAVSDVVVVSGASGLHARPAARLVELSKTFESEVSIARGDKVANGKSLIAVLRLGVTGGDQVRVTTAGADESEALRSVLELLADSDGAESNP
jgi:phosphotransferase system HPr (HPr) family protein